MNIMLLRWKLQISRSLNILMESKKHFQLMFAEYSNRLRTVAIYQKHKYVCNFTIKSSDKYLEKSTARFYITCFSQINGKGYRIYDSDDTIMWRKNKISIAMV